MLQSIREHTQGWIAGTIVSIIILSFALWGIHSYFNNDTKNSIVAEVNGVDITKEQLAVAYERLRRQTQIQLGSNNLFSPKEESTLKLKAIQALTEIEVLKQTSLNQGYHISSQQIDNYLQSMPDFQINGQFSVDKFQQILSSTLLSVSEFLELIKTSLLIDQPKLGIIFTSFALPEETNNTYALVNQERAIEYLTIPFQNFLSSPKNIVTDKQVQQYYQQHQSDFMTPEQVSVEYLELSYKDLLPHIKTEEQSLNKFYQDNIHAYTQALSWKLGSLLIPINNSTPQETVTANNKVKEIEQTLAQSNEHITSLMHRYPDQTFNSQKFLSLDQIPVEYQKIIVQLNKTKPFVSIPTKKGIMIVLLLDSRESKVQPFESVKVKVEQAYKRQHAEEKFAEWREKLANLTYEHPDSLSIAAKILGLPIKQSLVFTKEKGQTDISQYKKIRETAFSHDVLNLQNNSDVIQIHPELLVVLRTKTHIPATLLPLNNVFKQIAHKIQLEQAQLQAEKVITEIKTQLKSGVSQQAVASKYHLNWHKTGYLSRYSTAVDSAILDLAFRLPDPASIKNQAIFDSTRLMNGFAIVGLKSLKNVMPNDSKQYAIFSEQVQNSEGLLEYELYKQGALVSSSIKIF